MNQCFITTLSKRCWVDLTMFKIYSNMPNITMPAANCDEYNICLIQSASSTHHILNIADWESNFTRLSTVPRPVPRSVPTIFSIWFWYDPSWNMGVKPLPTALNHVKVLPAKLSFSLGKHLMKIFFSSLTFLYCPNIVVSPPSVIYSKLSMVSVHLQIYLSLIPDQISRISTPVTWIPLFFFHLTLSKRSFYPYALHFGTTSQVFVILQDSCSLPSCVIFVYLILFYLVLFSLPFFLFLFNHFSVRPFLYFVWCILASL